MDPEAFLYLALSGEQQLADDERGVVVVDAARGAATFTPLDALRPEAFATQLGADMERHPELIYVAQRTPEHMHVFTYPRATAMHKMREGTLALGDAVDTAASDASAGAHTAVPTS